MEVLHLHKPIIEYQLHRIVFINDYGYSLSSKVMDLICAAEFFRFKGCKIREQFLSVPCEYFTEAGFSLCLIENRSDIFSSTIFRNQFSNSSSVIADSNCSVGHHA